MTPGGQPGGGQPGGGQASRPAVKCVAWDIDNTLLTGTFIESGTRQPDADPEMAAALAELARRGIVHAIASRNPPAAASYAAQVTGGTFVAVECGWDRKSAAIGRILAELGIGADALAFVDDDPYERAEVSFVLPDVLVLSPEDMTDALGWPEFSPAVVTDEGRRRSELYLDRERRQQAEREFGGSRDAFLRYCRTEIAIALAGPADVPRLHELSVRTHQFNSAGQGATEAAFLAMIGSPERDVMTVRLRDRFGDDGVVGGCVTERGEDGRWTVRLLMMSCRAMGRGVIDALLAWLIRSAAEHGAPAVDVPSVLNARNVPLRLALAAAGFRVTEAGTEQARTEHAGAQAASGASSPAAAGQRVVYRRTLSGSLPELPGWLAGPATHDRPARARPAGGQEVRSDPR
jgi:methoxymalonate biosynthesis protein